MGEEYYTPLIRYFGEEPEDQSYNGGILPEIIVTPTKYTKDAQNKLKQIIPNKNLRKSVMNSRHSEQDEYRNIDRLYEIWNRSQRPTIKPYSEQGWFQRNIVQKLADLSLNVKGNSHRANYNPYNNSMYIKSYDDLISEMAHAYQYYNKNVPKGGLFNTGLGLPSDIKIGDDDGYHRYSHPEFMAHEIIEPKLEEYIQYGHPFYRPLGEYDEIITDMYNNPGKYGIDINNAKRIIGRKRETFTSDRYINRGIPHLRK